MTRVESDSFGARWAVLFSLRSLIPYPVPLKAGAKGRMHPASYISAILTLSLPQTLIIGFCKQHSEPSHMDLRCLTSSLSTLQLNLIPSDSLLKNKTDDICRLKCGTGRVKGLNETQTPRSVLLCVRDHYENTPFQIY